MARDIGVDEQAAKVAVLLALPDPQPRAHLLRVDENSTEIDDRRRMAEALGESETRFRELAENIQSAFFLRSADWQTLLYVSPAYEKIFGKSCASLYADPFSWSYDIQPDDVAQVMAGYELGKTTGNFEFEYRLVRADGSIRWILSRGFSIYDDDGRAVQVACLADDITERKLASEVLRESERRFRQLADNIRTVFFLVDFNGQMLYANPA